MILAALVRRLPRALPRARRASALLLAGVLALASVRPAAAACAPAASARAAGATGDMAGMTMPASPDTRHHAPSHAPADGCATDGAPCVASGHCAPVVTTVTVATTEPTPGATREHAAPLPVASQSAPEPLAPPPRA